MSEKRAERREHLVNMANLTSMWRREEKEHGEGRGGAMTEERERRGERRDVGKGGVRREKSLHTTVRKFKNLLKKF